MLIQGPEYRHCDGLSRRSFLRLSLAGFGGAWAATQASGAASPGPRHKAVIMIYMPGGPSHLDMYDLKPGAPAEIRGEFRPIATAVPGVQICELMPRLAQAMHRLVVVRSIADAVDDHAAHTCLTGWSRLGPQPAGGWPAMGSLVSRVQGPTQAGMPPFVALSRIPGHNFDVPGAGLLGVGHQYFNPNPDVTGDLTLQGVSLARLGERKTFLDSLDRLRRDADLRGLAQGVDELRARGLAALADPAILRALDLSQEDPRTVERYLAVGHHLEPDTRACLLARRLVEAGVRFVSLSFSYVWDTHINNFTGLRDVLPVFDRTVATLVEDLHERGLADDVALVAWGEMGRTPRINQTAGRDHWAPVSNALLAGGGWPAGQVIGATSPWGDAVVDRPLKTQQLHTTLYRHLGIDPGQVTLTDLAGRPQYLLEHTEPISELTG